PRPPRRRRRARCSGLGSPRVAPPALPSFPPRRSSDLIDQGQRRIPVQFAKRVRGRRVLGGQSTYIPLKVNVSGVIPVIFATSVLLIPALIVTAIPFEAPWLQSIFRWINENLGTGQTGVSWWYIVVLFGLIVFFTYFYTAIQFNPEQQAEIIQR